MLPPPALDKRFMQLCWVVPDIHAAMASWTRTAGVGPFFYFEDVTFEDGRYRGRPAQMAKHQAAIAQAEWVACSSQIAIKGAGPPAVRLANW